MGAASRRAPTRRLTYWTKADFSPASTAARRPWRLKNRPAPGMETDIQPTRAPRPQLGEAGPLAACGSRAHERSASFGGRRSALSRVRADPASVPRAGPVALAPLRLSLYLDGHCRRLHGVFRLSHRQRHQRSLCQPQPARHHRPGRHHRGVVLHQGDRHLRPERDALAHRQPHHRRQPARGVRQAAQRGSRFLLRPPFDRVHHAAVGRRRSRRHR